MRRFEAATPTYDQNFPTPGWSSRSTSDHFLRRGRASRFNRMSTPTIDEIYRREEIRQAELGLRPVAAHEHGHGLVASRLGLKNEVHVAGPDAGICSYRTSSAFHRAAVGWGGVLGEALMGLPAAGHNLPTFRPTAENLRDWCQQVRIYELSPSDQEAIGMAEHHAACRAAFDILSRNLDVLVYLTSSHAQRVAPAVAERGHDPARASLELDHFSSEFHMEWNMEAALQRGDEILASLPPCPLPADKRFNFASFVECTGASEADVLAFVRDQTRREAWQVGRTVGENEFATAEKFFREHRLNSRGPWIASAKEFAEWNKQRERNTNEH